MQRHDRVRRRAHEENRGHNSKRRGVRHNTRAGTKIKRTGGMVGIRLLQEMDQRYTSIREAAKAHRISFLSRRRSNSATGTSNSNL